MMKEPTLQIRSPLRMVRENIENMTSIVDVYSDELADLEITLKLKGKTLEKANVEQPSWLAYYDQRRLELKSVLDYLDLRVEQTYGKLWRQYTENYSRDLAPKDKENYIKHDEKYIAAKNLFLEMQDLYSKYQMAVDAFQARGYALNNVTRAKVAAVGDAIL